MSRSVEASLGGFLVDVDKWKARLGHLAGEAIQELCLVVAQNIVVGGQFSPGTPVDTGYARSSWWIAVNSDTGESAVLGLNDKGAAAMEQITLRILGVKSGDIVYLLTNTVYMRPLEYGHSQQAPAGMVRLTMAAGTIIADYAAINTLRRNGMAVA